MFQVWSHAASPKDMSRKFLARVGRPYGVEHRGKAPHPLQPRRHTPQQCSHRMPAKSRGFARKSASCVNCLIQPTSYRHATGVVDSGENKLIRGAFVLFLLTICKPCVEISRLVSTMATNIILEAKRSPPPHTQNTTVTTLGSCVFFLSENW